MKVLGAQPPTAEQLRIISEKRSGVEIIRGAAGSGKTTTALLRLKNLSDRFRARHVRLGIKRPVRVLVLTYNRTLCGYVEALANEQADTGPGIDIEVNTFAGWAWQRVGKPKLIGNRTSSILRLARSAGLRLPEQFICNEVEYVLGRFRDGGLNAYLDAERTGRGISPRVERPARQIILNIIDAYRAELAAAGKVDWEDLPALVQAIPSFQFDIVIVDEAQDFSANQLQAVVHHLAEERALTLVIDTAQRLYPRGYTWAEAGLDKQVRFYRLQQNHRNTVQIAKFAKGVLHGLKFDDDGTLPDLDRAVRNGPKPKVIKGLYSEQLDFSIQHIRTKVNLSSESVAFLKPLGGKFFKALRDRLSKEHLSFDEITREKDWPDGPDNIVLSTMHSAKGLEFDHVIILGLNAEVTPHPEDDDDQLETLRRLLAMAAARARKTVLVGFKPAEASDLVEYLEDGTFTEIDL